jgi:hypothetical protein
MTDPASPSLLARQRRKRRRRDERRRNGTARIWKHTSKIETAAVKRERLSGEGTRTRMA